MSGVGPDAVNVADVTAALNSIVDPCSAAAGMPAGLADMGLVGPIQLRADGLGQHVDVTLLTTHPFCMMAAVFISEAVTALERLEGVSSVSVSLDPSLIWTPDRMAPAYAARLEAMRDATLFERTPERQAALAPQPATS